MIHLLLLLPSLTNAGSLLLSKCSGRRVGRGRRKKPSQHRLGPTGQNKRSPCRTQFIKRLRQQSYVALPYYDSRCTIPVLTFRGKTYLPVSLRRLRAQESGCRHDIARRPRLASAAIALTMTKLYYSSSDSFIGTINRHRSYLSQWLLNMTYFSLALYPYTSGN